MIFLCARGAASYRRDVALLSVVVIGEGMTDERSRQVVEVCEKYADGRIGERKLSAARRAAAAGKEKPPEGVLWRFADEP